MPNSWPNTWNVYYVIFLSALMSLGIPAALAGISFLVSPRKQRRAKEPPRKIPAEKGGHATMGQKINIRFFLAANSALILLTLGLVLIPCTAALQPGSRSGLLTGLLAIVTVAGFAALGLLYSARKGDLSWLTTFGKKGG